MKSRRIFTILLVAGLAIIVLGIVCMAAGRNVQPKTYIDQASGTTVEDDAAAIKTEARYVAAGSWLVTVGVLTAGAGTVGSFKKKRIQP